MLSHLKKMKQGQTEGWCLWRKWSGGLCVKAGMSDQARRKKSPADESTEGFKNGPGWVKWVMDGEESCPVDFRWVKRSGREVLVKVGGSW